MTMLANELTPFCPTHPGEILKDEVEYRKISQCRRDIICRWRVPISARKIAGMKYVSCVHRSFDAHNCICYQRIYSTYSTNPFRYSPSGW